MAPRERTDLRALRNLISEAELILSTTNLPEGRTPRSLELIRSAISLADDMLRKEDSKLETSPAALLGRKGGSATAKRGPDYFAKIAAMRKTRAGGRPRKAE